MKYKYCNYCQKDHPATKKFWTVRKSGRLQECVKKHREKSLEYAKKASNKNPYKKLIKYNLTENQYFEMIRKCANRCGICGKEFDKNRRICIDHNHTTGDVRGLLCTTCNTGLGLFKDSILILCKAIRYLLRSWWKLK